MQEQEYNIPVIHWYLTA